MSARRKLNGMYACGCVVLAAFIGLVSQSWWGFGISLVLAAATQVVSGNIRLAVGRRY